MESTTFLNITNQTEAPMNTSSVSGDFGDCFIDPQLAYIVVLSAGSLILVLLISVLVLAYKVVTLKRRPTRSNVESTGSGHWSTEQAEKGIVGPCETNLLLEDVQTDADDAEVQEEEEAMLHQSNTEYKDEENVLPIIQSSTSRDSCIDSAKELENMPLVV